MSAPVLSLAPIVARIEAAALYRSVGGAADMRRAAQSGAMGSPLAFVMPGAEATRPSGMVGGTQHSSVTARFIVVTLAEDIRHDAGLRAVSQLEEVRAGLLSALAGWGPDYADGPVSHLSGQLVTGPLPGGLLGWQDEFSLRFRRRLTTGG
ncbi:hypothetical protein SAMN05443999_101254 [Roseovarius azorensis]|uniref:Tail terminator n=1 Tax=Roseovarius azorensis TaxID=1287727 RepID=A0A1H7G8P8_9RHOB|nr:hypothetical protein [Roseovarius azorensis]SEK34501.1 hypothetical protein SAMN05443999_101254 [Roseovarius azorensis]